MTVPCWEPGTQYNYDDVVEYEGAHYKIIQPHRSQGDWTPPITPALWGKMQNHSHHQPQQQAGGSQQPQQVPPPSYNYGHDDKYNNNQGDSGNDDNKNSWFDDHKTELGIAGGILGGAALLGGGFFAYKHHEKTEDQRKVHEAGAAAWVQDAQQRTNQYLQYGPRSPATWVLNKGTNIPKGAIIVGQEKSWTLYICRAYFDGGIMVGKASPAFKKGGVIGYKNEEQHVDTYEILLGDMSRLTWVPTRGRLNVGSLGLTPVEGGRENDGTLLYVAKAKHKGAEHPGKASEKLDGAYIPYDGEEECIKEYSVLCYA